MHGKGQMVSSVGRHSLGGNNPQACKRVEFNGMRLTQTIVKRVKKTTSGLQSTQKCAAKTTSGLLPPSWKHTILNWANLNQSQSMEKTRPPHQEPLQKITTVQNSSHCLSQPRSAMILEKTRWRVSDVTPLSRVKVGPSRNKGTVSWHNGLPAYGTPKTHNNDHGMYCNEVCCVQWPE